MEEQKTVEQILGEIMALSEKKLAIANRMIEDMNALASVSADIGELSAQLKNAPSDVQEG